MLVLITYDVNTSTSAGAKRLRQTAKLCEKFGVRVQNSVFEVLVDAAQLTALKHEMKKIINEKEDSVRFYRLGNTYQNRNNGKNTTGSNRRSTYFVIARESARHI